jgi:transcriptional regulator with XRE-family HTH domain
MLDKENILIQFGKSLREVRLSRALSQEGLALALGFDRTYISLLERGKRNPSLFVMCKIADHLEVEVSDLMPKTQLPPAELEV